MAELPSLIPSIPLDFAGRRSLRFDRKAVFQAELELSRLWGKDMTFFQAIVSIARFFTDNDWGGLSLNNLSALLLYGLKHESPALTLEEVQEALPIYDQQALILLASKILEAWQAQSPQGRETQDTEAIRTDPLDGSSGNSSGRLSAYASV
jgi:hypothetical protein